MCDTVDPTAIVTTEVPMTKSTTDTTTTSTTAADETPTSPLSPHTKEKKHVTKRMRDDELVAKYNSKMDAKKEIRYARKKLRKHLGSFQRHFELESGEEVDQDCLGVVGHVEKGTFLGCPISNVFFLLENNEIDMVNEESSVKCFSESEYGRISEFPAQLDRLALHITKAAQLARDAGIDKVQEGDKEGDEDDEDEDEDEESSGSEVDEEEDDA
jgi:hypothetical protein